MSNSLLNSEQIKRITEQGLRLFIRMHEENEQAWREIMERRNPKTCLSCGSATQPCCGH